MWELHERDVRCTYVWGVCVRMHCSASVYASVHVRGASVWVIVQTCERCIVWLIDLHGKNGQGTRLLCSLAKPDFACVERIWYWAYIWISRLGIYLAFIYTHSKLSGLSSNHWKWWVANHLFCNLHSWLQWDKSVYRFDSRPSSAYACARARLYLWYLCTFRIHTSKHHPLCIAITQTNNP